MKYTYLFFDHNLNMKWFETTEYFYNEIMSERKKWPTATLQQIINIYYKDGVYNDWISTLTKFCDQNNIKYKNMIGDGMGNYVLKMKGNYEV